MRPTRRRVISLFPFDLLLTYFSQLRKFRAVPTVEMLRATWHKTSNPFVSLRPGLGYFSKLIICAYRYVWSLIVSP